MGLSKRSRGSKQPVAFNPDDASASADVAVEGSATKKVKTSSSTDQAQPSAEAVEEDEEADTPAEVWEDAKELWEKAMEAAGAADPSPAVPLLRGLINEVDRILRNAEDSSNPLQPTDAADSSSAADEPSSAMPISSKAFFHIYGTSLSTLGLILSQLPTLADPSEPTPLDFHLAAISTFEDAITSSTSPTDVTLDWKVLIANGRSLVLAASEQLDLPPPRPSKSKAKSTEPEPAQKAVENLTAAVGLFKRAIESLPASPSSAAATPVAATRDPVTSFLTTSLPLTSRLRTLLNLGTSLAVLLERLPRSSSSDFTTLTEFTSSLLTSLLAESAPLPDAKEWEYELSLARGAMSLGLGTRDVEFLEALDDLDDDDDCPSVKEIKSVKLSLRTNFESALESLGRARAIKPRKVVKEREEDEDEVSPMLVETALTLAGMVFGGESDEDGVKRNELEELARREGWEGEESDEEEEDEEVE